MRVGGDVRLRGDIAVLSRGGERLRVDGYVMGSACRGFDVGGRLVAFLGLDSEEESNLRG